MEKKNVIIWNAVKFAKLADSLRKESENDTRIGYGKGYLSKPLTVNVNGTGYAVKAVSSYSSAMGLLIKSKTTGASILIVTDENHSITATTAKHLSRLCKDNDFLIRYNLYTTRAGYEVNFGGCMYYTRDPWDWKADSANGFTQFFKYCHDNHASLSEILDAVNNGLRHEWNKVTE